MIKFNEIVKLTRHYNIFPNTFSKVWRLMSLQVAQKVEQEKIINDNFDRNQKELISAQPYYKVPGPKPSQLLLWFLPGGRLHKKSVFEFHELMKQLYGDICRLPGLFGKQDIVVVFNPDDYEKVFRNEGVWPNRAGMETMTHFRRVLRKDVYEGAEGLVTSNGEEWSRLRSIANPVLMQPKTIRIYVPRMNIVASEFVENIRQIRDPTTLEAPEDFSDHINNWTLESVCLAALDTKINLIKDDSQYPDATELKKALKVFFEILVKLEFMPSIWKLLPTPNYNKLMTAMNTITDITMKYTEEAINKMDLTRINDEDISNKSVLERLARIDKKFAFTMAMDLLFAGVDTTASAFTGCLATLAKNPEKQELLRKEVLNILPDKNSPMTSENMKNLPFLRACIKEALRIYPIAPGNMRGVAHDIVLSGYRIPKGIQVFMPATLLYRDNQHFLDSSKFVPERWLRTDTLPDSTANCPYSGGKGKSSNPFAYLPFGFGPRMCIGKRFVEMELEIGLAKVIRNFKIEFNYPVENLFKMNIINVPNMPLKFKFIDL